MCSGWWSPSALVCSFLSLLFAQHHPAAEDLHGLPDAQACATASDATQTSGIVMLAYTLMLCATSTGAYATIFVVLFGWDRCAGHRHRRRHRAGLLHHRRHVVHHPGRPGPVRHQDRRHLLPDAARSRSTPPAASTASAARVDASFFQIDGIGVQTIITYFVVYTLGLLIGQDIWQRVFTAKTPTVARWGGATAGIYCILYGAAGALIGLGRPRCPARTSTSPASARTWSTPRLRQHLLPIGIGGLVLAAAVAAMMSTASGALIAAATVARADVLPFVASWFGKDINTDDTDNPEHDVKANRMWVLGLGHRGHRHRHHHQGRGGRPDHRLRHPGGRAPGGHPRRPGLEARHRRRPPRPPWPWVPSSRWAP